MRLRVQDCLFTHELRRTRPQTVISEDPSAAPQATGMGTHHSLHYVLSTMWRERESMTPSLQCPDGTLKNSKEMSSRVCRPTHTAGISAGNTGEEYPARSERPPRRHSRPSTR